MNQIVTCSCGAKVRVPAEASRALRCPRCKSTIAVPAEVTAGESAPAAVTASGAVCPICQTTIAATEEVVTCPACDQVHHHECWTEIGGCGTYGCESAPAIDKADAEPARRSAWGDTKDCPACGETIKATALRCRYCKTEFDTVDPLTARDLRRRARRQDEFRSLRNTSVAVFILSVIGLLAPIMVFVAPLVVLPRRRKLAKAGPVYAVLGYAAVGLSVLWAALWVGLIAAG
jgi:hypothetical protein